MARLRFAEVRCRGRRAGLLLETPGGGSVFEYAEDAGEDVGCALPRDQRTHAWAAGVHPFFQHLGPEGWLRSRQARTAELDEQDDLGLLLRYGADCIGAVSVHDPDAPATPPAEEVLDALTLAAVEARRTISGVQPKLLARAEGDRVVPAGPEGAAPLIAKFPTSDLPELAPNEALSLELARMLLGADRVTESRLGTVEGIRPPALLVVRFDRTPDGEKLRLEDFAQVLAVPRGRDWSGKYDASYEEAAAAIERFAAAPRIDLLRYLERIAASFLLGDCDCHLKNFSLLETPGGLRLSPAYDIVNTYVFAAQGYSTRFGLRLGGRARQWDEITRDTFRALGADLDLPPRAVERALTALVRKREPVLRRLAPRPEWADDHWRVRYRAIVDDAFSRLEG